VESEGHASRRNAAHISTVMWPRCVGSCREAEAQARSRSSSWTGVSRAARRTVHRSGSAVSWTRHIMPRSGARAAPASPREEPHAFHWKMRRGAVVWGRYARRPAVTSWQISVRFSANRVANG